MAYLQLRPHVSYGIIGQHAVFLDLSRDRYLALDPGTQDAFLAASTAAEPIVAEGPVRSRLMATGLFREHSLRGRLAPAEAPFHARSLLDETPGRTRWSDVPRAWRCVARARRRIRAEPILAIVTAIRERRYGLHARCNDPSIEDEARRFLAARALVPVARSCLLDCLALVDWLGDDAPLPALVFGVRMDPFGAHCWLQSDRMLLTDASDSVRPFTPVLAV